MFEWCSISVMSTSSPSPTLSRPHAYATRLIASVALRVKIEHCGSQPTNEAIRVRAASNASVDSRASSYTPRWMGAYDSRWKPSIAAITCSGRCEVAAESRYATRRPPNSRASTGKSARTSTSGLSAVERHQPASARSPMNSLTWSSASASFSEIRRRTRSSSPGSSSRCTTSSK